MDGEIEAAAVASSIVRDKTVACPTPICRQAADFLLAIRCGSLWRMFFCYFVRLHETMVMPGDHLMSNRSQANVSMNAQTSVSVWIRELQAGNREAAQELWERYFQRLVQLAQKRLPNRLRRHADEEDVALSAFNSFCRGVSEGRYPQLTDREDLWRLLVTITAHKAIHVARRANRLKRGGGKNTPADDDVSAVALNEAIGREPTPEFSLQCAEELDRLLSLLNDETLRSVAICKMEGFTNSEIANKLNCTSRTVERKLRLIRRIWEEAL
jgi:RNA polymerase sigma factor (sigma-70 family)